MTKRLADRHGGRAADGPGRGTSPLRGWLAERLAERDVSWSIGALGAIAEFHWVNGDTVLGERLDDEGPLSVVTPRGAVALTPDPELRPVPWESLSPTPGRWRQEVLLCLPRARARIDGPRVLAEMGPDVERALGGKVGAGSGHEPSPQGPRRAGSPGGAGALGPEAGEELLFDLGLPLPHVRALVRTSDPALLRELRRGAGRPLLEPGNPALGAIKEASPARIFRSRAGRIEVYQRIGSSRHGIPTPEGPHTHLLPALLERARTHAAGAPVPRGLVPVATLYPPHPLVDPAPAPAHGPGSRYDPERQARFERWLERWGDRDTWSEKRRVRAAVARGDRPEGYPPPPTRRGRIALRVTLRQLAAAHPESELVMVWRSRFDRERSGREGGH